MSPQAQPPRGKGRRPAPAPKSAPWWRTPNGLTLIGTAVVAVAIVVVLVISTSLGGGPAPKGEGVAVPSVLQAVSSPSPAVVDTVGTGDQPGNLTRTPGASIQRSASGLPMVTYVGAEFCPYCGAERWVIVMTMDRFGKFSGIQEDSSSSTDVYPNTSTFTFLHATYSSAYVAFQSVEMEDRSENPLQTPTPEENQLFTTYDQSPYTSTTEGYPFLDIGGRFYLYNTSYSPAILQGLSWTQIAADLKNSSSPVTQAIVGNANLLTAAVCEVTDDQPASVCSAPYIKAATAVVNSQPDVSGS